MDYKTLSEIATNFRYGKMPDKSKITDCGNYPVWSGYRYVGYYDEKNVDKDEIVVVARGVGGTGDVKICREDCFLTNLSIAFKVNEDINPLYVYYFYQIKNLRYLDSGSAQSQITINDLKNVKIPIPNKNIQDKIVEVLNKIDQKIELNNEINNNLYELQKQYFKKLFNNDLYSEKKIGDIFDISAGGDAPKDKFDYKTDDYKYPIISNGIDNEGIYGYCKDYKIDKKSVTISARGTIGYKVLRNYNYYPIVRLISLIPKDDNISSEYLFYALDDIKILGTGTTQQQLTVPMVKDIKIKVYDKQTIKIFTNFSSKLNEKIDNNKEENKKLEQLRDTLLPKLMNGEIDLTNITF